MTIEPLRYVTHNGLEYALCPLCGERTDAEYVDIGVGYQRVEPWHCQPCGWVESMPADDLVTIKEPL